MLCGYWLLSDLDGTLVSTPHKAQGCFLPVSASPCYQPLVRWLQNGGNICLVTTADQRAIRQVYFPLRAYLRQRHADASRNNACTERNENVTNLASSRGRMSLSAAASTDGGGMLLLSIYTGAVLYSCTFEGIEVVPGYMEAVHSATMEAVEQTRIHKVTMQRHLFRVPDAEDPIEMACVKGTCMDNGTCNELQRRIHGIYTGYLSDVLRGDTHVVQALPLLSLRYKNMWTRLLTFLEALYRHSRGEAPISEPVLEVSEAFARALRYSNDAEAVTWKMQYFNSCTDLLLALGIVRLEHAASPVFCEFSSTECVDARRNCLQVRAVEYACATLSKGLPSDQLPGVMSTLQEFARDIVHQLGTIPYNVSRESTTLSSSFPDVAQVIVLGMPLALYSRYFYRALPDFVRAGVHPLPQPNSVVFSKLGVSKSTALRYLLGKSCAVESTELPRGEPDSRYKEFAGVVCSRKALAIGDNPHATDYELTVFPDVSFLSVEKDRQRFERHLRIARRLQRTRKGEEQGVHLSMPDGSLAPSYKELSAALLRSGPMMDDRRLTNLHYTGGEEDGTAEFLTSIMDFLQVPSLSTAQQRQVAAVTAVSSTVFKEGVRRAAKDVHLQIYHRQLDSNL